MATRIYVGNLPYTADNEQLADLFRVFGPVVEAAIVYDRASGQSKGFGFVQMASDEAAQHAIAALNGTMFGNRTIRVNEAQERTFRPDGGNRGGGGYGGRGGYGGGRDSGGYGRGNGGYSRESSGGFGGSGSYGRSSGGYGGGCGYNDRPSRRDDGYTDSGYSGGRGYRDSGNSGFSGYNNYSDYSQPNEEGAEYDRRMQGRERDRARRERDW